MCFQYHKIAFCLEIFNSFISLQFQLFPGCGDTVEMEEAGTVTNSLCGGDTVHDFISAGNMLDLKLITDTDGSAGQGFQFHVESSKFH